MKYLRPWFTERITAWRVRRYVTSQVALDNWLGEGGQK